MLVFLVKSVTWNLPSNQDTMVISWHIDDKLQLCSEKQIAATYVLKDLITWYLMSIVP